MNDLKHSKKRGELLWPRMLVKKWLHIKSNGEEFSADEFSADEHEDTEPDTESESESESKSKVKRFAPPRRHTTRNLSSLLPKKDEEATQRGSNNVKGGELKTIETQYNKQEFRIAVSTWNVAGRCPPPQLELRDWLEMSDPADIYVVGFQEIVPLNAGNVFGAEDTAPASKWEALIRETLNRPGQSMTRCYSAPSSPSRELASGTSEILHRNAEVDAECIMIDEETSFIPLKLYPSSSKEGSTRQSSVDGKQRLVEVYRSTERIGFNVSRHQRTESAPMSWLSACNLEEDGLSIDDEALARPLLSPINLDSSTLTDPVKRILYVRVASKQMVGIHVSVWVRRKLRRYIRNLTCSCVGLGIMGCLGNKGSISISMLLHQTSLCFVCTHLTSGDREGDELRRNEDVYEILKRTRFPPIKAAHTGAPKSILGHDRIVWFGDLNYRLSLPDNDARFYVGREDWTALLKKDQLRREFLKGRVFEGWHEGFISFAPTYKYEFGSNTYSGDGAKSGEKRRTPAWCDRILWRGKGLKQLMYGRVESTFSDHRPVKALFVAEVEVINQKKLKKALTFKSAKVEIEELLAHAQSYVDNEKSHFEDR